MSIQRLDKSISRVNDLFIKNSDKLVSIMSKSANQKRKPLKTIERLQTKIAVYQDKVAQLTTKRDTIFQKQQERAQKKEAKIQKRQALTQKRQERAQKLEIQLQKKIQKIQKRKQQRQALMNQQKDKKIRTIQQENKLLQKKIKQLQDKIKPIREKVSKFSLSDLQQSFTNGRAQQQEPVKKIVAEFSLYRSSESKKKRTDWDIIIDPIDEQRYAYVIETITFDIAKKGEFVVFEKDEATKKLNAVNYEYDFDDLTVGTLYTLRHNRIITRTFIELLKEPKFCRDAVIIGQIAESMGFDGIVLNSIIEVDEDYKEFNVLNRLLNKDAENKFINSNYISYVANPEATNINELFIVKYNDYVKHNFHPNSCVLTAICNKYYEHFNRRKPDGKRCYKFDCTYKSLAELLKIEYNENGNMACSIEQMLTFFKTFSFTELIVYDPFMKLIYHHKSEDSRKIVLRLMLHGDHVYQLNDVKELQQRRPEELEEKIISVYNKYVIFNNNVEGIKTVFCQDYKQISDEIIAAADSDEDLKKLKIITNHSMNEISYKLINECKYVPKVYFHTFIYKIALVVPKNVDDYFIVEIENIDVNPVYGKMANREVITNIQQYDDYNKCFVNAYDKIFKKEHLSEYHTSTINIEENYKIGPVIGYFNNKNVNLLDDFDSIDENKAYSACLKSITKIPIFHYFDVYKKYDGHQVEDLTYYIIEVLDNKKETTILCSDRYSRVFGCVLNQSKFKYKILYYRRPHKIEEVDYSSVVEEVYNNEFKSFEDEDEVIKMKKNICNKITGLLEMKYNKQFITKVFINKDEANEYRQQYSGQLHYCKVEDKKFMYIVNVSKKARLINGFTPIKDLIYCMQRVKLYNNYLKLVDIGAIPIGVKTDCIYFQIKNESLMDLMNDDDEEFYSVKPNYDIIKENFEINNKVGGYKLEYKKEVPNKALCIINNDLIDIPDFDDVNVKQFEDEFNTDNIINFIKEKKRVFIKGMYPGVGKSTVAKNLANQLKNNCLFILPYNKLCQNLKKDKFQAITFNKLFGLDINENENKNMKKFDISDFEMICFDEAYLLVPDRLKKIDQLMAAHPEKICIGTGDCDQRDPIGFNDTNYLNHSIDVIFKNQILLNTIKRLTNKEDIPRWINLKKDIFNTKISIEELCKKHNLKTIECLSKLETKTNISYFNFRCDNINNQINRNVLKNKYNFNEGDEIVCRKSYRGKFVLHTNYCYKIIKIKNSIYTIKDEVDDIEYNIDSNIIHDHFRLSYCYTCDSIQGMSFEEDTKLTIFDSNLPYVDRKFIWTAITRARKLDNVFIFIHSEEEKKRLSNAKMMQYLKFKVDGYKQQDKKKSRTFKEEEYINNKWIYDELEISQECRHCKKSMYIYIDENNNVQSNITANRIDDNLAHTKKNCVLSCLHCNISRIKIISY